MDVHSAEITPLPNATHNPIRFRVNVFNETRGYKCFDIYLCENGDVYYWQGHLDLDENKDPARAPRELPAIVFWSEDKGLPTCFDDDVSVNDMWTTPRPVICRIIETGTINVPPAFKMHRGQLMELYDIFYRRYVSRTEEVSQSAS